MPTYTFNGLIGEDHRVELPSDIPTGWAEIVVITGPNGDRRAPLDAVLRELVQRQPRNRSKQDIDTDLRAERESWE